MPKGFILAVASLLGTIIGAGVFALPFIAFQSGIFVLAIYFLFLTATVLVLHLLYSEVILKTTEKHRLAGYVEKYLGKRAKRIVGSANILGCLAALLAYLILGAGFLRIIFGNNLGILPWAVIFWLLMSFLVLLGIKNIAKAEVFFGLALLLVISIIFIFALPHFKITNFVFFNKNNLFSPFGIVLFSLVGWSALPEVASLIKDKKYFKKAIIFSTVGAAFFYLCFALILSGSAGSKISQDSFSGLAGILGDKIVFLGGLFGLLTVATSFLILANYLKNTLSLDYHWPRAVAFLTAVSLPLLAFLIGLRDFIQVIGLAGVILGFIEGVAIILLYQKVRKHSQNSQANDFLKLPDYLLYLIIALLAIGSLSVFIDYFV